MLLVIDTAGNIKTLDSDEAKPFIEMGERVSRKRASHVEPVNWILRIIFRFIRWATGETGKVSDFTRQWRVQWRVDLSPSGGPIIGPFKHRGAAIYSEIEWLNLHGFNKDVNMARAYRMGDQMLHDKLNGRVM